MAYHRLPVDISGRDCRLGIFPGRLRPPSISNSEVDDVCVRPGKCGHGLQLMGALGIDVLCDCVVYAEHSGTHAKSPAGARFHLPATLSRKILRDCLAAKRVMVLFCVAYFLRKPCNAFGH